MYYILFTCTILLKNMNESALKPGFGKRLQEERKKLGLNQTDFAAPTGVKRLTQYLYEKEEYPPTYPYLAAIDKLGADIHYILFGYHHDDQSSLHISRLLLENIYKAVDELARDEHGNPLDLAKRTEFFNLLCSVYNKRDDNVIDLKLVNQLIGSR